MISIFCLLTANHKLEKCLHAFLFIPLKNTDSHCETRTTSLSLCTSFQGFVSREKFSSQTNAACLTDFDEYNQGGESKMYILIESEKIVNEHNIIVGIY